MHIRNQVPEWANKCEDLDLLILQWDYIAFLFDIEMEIHYLEHFLDCEICLKEIRLLVESKETETGWGKLFAREAGTIHDKRPIYKNFPSTDAFIEARILWRLEKLRSLAIDAEMELEDLRERIRNREKNYLI